MREKYLIMDFRLIDTDYLSFIRRKEIDHDELANLSEQTQGKVKQVIFKILEQAGILNNIKDREIQLQILDQPVMEVIIEDSPEWLMIFMMSDYDIQKISI